MKKFKKNQRRGSINMPDAITAKAFKQQQEKFGKKYPTIDFLTNPDLSPEDFPVNNSMEIGALVVGNTQIEITHGEARKIIDTLTEAIRTTNMRYRIGILQR